MNTLTLLFLIVILMSCSMLETNSRYSRRGKTDEVGDKTRSEVLAEKIKKYKKEVEEKEEK